MRYHASQTKPQNFLLGDVCKWLDRQKPDDSLNENPESCRSRGFRLHAHMDIIGFVVTYIIYYKLAFVNTFLKNKSRSNCGS